MRVVPGTLIDPLVSFSMLQWITNEIVHYYLHSSPLLFNLFLHS
jgi:hypothetical protein